MTKMTTILSIIIGAILLDIFSKGTLIYLITDGVPLYGSAFEIIPVPYLMTPVFNFFNIVFTWNPGASFSMFRTLGEAAPLVMIIITGIVISGLMYHLFRHAKSYEQAPLALIIGGAIGNLIDRIRFGAVVDFLDFHIGGYHWPAFNIADICIVIGVGWYLLNWYLVRRKCIKQTTNKGK